MTITAETLVAREVYYCVSSLVATLAGSHECFTPVTGFRHMDGAIATNVKALSEMVEQAFELACPIDDWEEAARQEGWIQMAIHGAFSNKTGEGFSSGGIDSALAGWRALCDAFDIEPYQREVFEHWIVSDWLADRLAEKGEKVDKDFAGLIVWARTTTGQGIASDSVIKQIVAELNAA